MLVAQSRRRRGGSLHGVRVCMEDTSFLLLVRRSVFIGSKTDNQEDVKRVGRKFVLFFTGDEIIA
jgi:hypothetical protein